MGHAELRAALGQPPLPRAVAAHCLTTCVASRATCAQLLGSNLRRGKVEAGIYLRSASADTVALELNGPLVERTAPARRRSGASCWAGRPPRSTCSTCCAGRAWCARPIATWHRWLAEAMSLLARNRRGAERVARPRRRAVRETLRNRCDALRERIATVRARMPEVRTRIQARVVGARRAARRHRRCRAPRAGDSCCSRTRWTSRRNSTVSAATSPRSLQMLDSKEPAGRRLDFLMQELNREANTLVVEVPGRGDHARRGGHQGADRADARAGAEHRVRS